MKKIMFMTELIALFLAMQGAALATTSEDQYEETDPGNGHTPVVVCHKPGTPAQQELTIDSNAVPAHLAHGDTLGACSPVEPPPEETTVINPPEETVPPPEETTVVDPPEETTVVDPPIPPPDDKEGPGTPPEETTVVNPPEETTVVNPPIPPNNDSPDDPNMPDPPMIVEVPDDSPEPPNVTVTVTKIDIPNKTVTVVTNTGTVGKVNVTDENNDGHLEEQEIIPAVQSAMVRGALPDTGGPTPVILIVAGLLLFSGSIVKRLIP